MKRQHKKPKGRPAKKRKTQGRKPDPPRRHKQNPAPGVQRLTRSVAALLDWSQKAEGLSGAIRNAYRYIESETSSAGAKHFVTALQKDRPILEELYVWAHESSRTIANPASKEALPAVVEEGIALVEALFSQLGESFDIDIIHAPDTAIATPPPRAKRYKFSERFNPALTTSRVLFPGLKQGSKVLAPCEVEQLPDATTMRPLGQL